MDAYNEICCFSKEIKPIKELHTLTLMIINLLILRNVISGHYLECNGINIIKRTIYLAVCLLEHCIQNIILYNITALLPLCFVLFMMFCFWFMLQLIVRLKQLLIVLLQTVQLTIYCTAENQSESSNFVCIEIKYLIPRLDSLLEV